MVLCGNITQELARWNEWGSPRGFIYETRGMLQIRRVDSYVNKHIDVVKVDIEGYEPEALRGMEQIFNRKRLPELVVSEFQPSILKSNGFDALKYLNFFSSRGYTIAVATGRSLKTVGRNEVEASKWLQETRWEQSYDLVMRQA